MQLPCPTGGITDPPWSQGSHPSPRVSLRGEKPRQSPRNVVANASRFLARPRGQALKNQLVMNRRVLAQCGQSELMLTTSVRGGDYPRTQRRHRSVWIHRAIGRTTNTARQATSVPQTAAEWRCGKPRTCLSNRPQFRGGAIYVGRRIRFTKRNCISAITATGRHSDATTRQPINFIGKQRGGPITSLWASEHTCFSLESKASLPRRSDGSDAAGVILSEQAGRWTPSCCCLPVPASVSFDRRARLVCESLSVSLIASAVEPTRPLLGASVRARLVAAEVYPSCLRWKQWFFRQRRFGVAAEQGQPRRRQVLPPFGERRSMNVRFPWLAKTRRLHPVP